MSSVPAVAGVRTTADATASRRRLTWTLVGTVGLGSSGNIAAVTVGTIAARDIAGSTALSGLPAATVVVGAALGSSILSALMIRRGRRIGLAFGYSVGVLGAFIAVTAVASASLPLLIAATVLIGFGGSSNQLSRYTAADMYPASRRGSAIATVVWGATIGAIVGPNLIAVAGGMATSVGMPALSGVYLVPAVFVGTAAVLVFILLRPDPYSLAVDVPPATAAESHMPIRDVLRRPSVAAALTTLVVGQVAMTVVMTMTPLHMTEHGGSLALVGLVVSAHTFGMYALAPLSGRLTDRFGSQPVILSGLATLTFAGLLAAAAPGEGGPGLLAALFLLGFGWNLCFVAGSNLLAAGLALAERTRLQGVTDTIIWSAAAVASLSSGVIVALVTYTGLGLLPAFLVMTPAWLLIRRRQAIARSLVIDEPSAAGAA
jgi:MFS family permease